MNLCPLQRVMALTSGIASRQLPILLQLTLARLGRPVCFSMMAKVCTMLLDAYSHTELISLVTPPGGESRLTLALKNYHLSKARTPSDLPSWLFSEEERRVRRDTYSSREERPMEMNVRAPRQSGLKSIYADAVSDTSMSDNGQRYRQGGSRSEPAGASSRFDPSTTQSKATSRLQAMRDARRPTVPVRENVASGRHVVSFDNGYEGQALRQQGETEMPRRVGLPRGPKQRLN
jgi:hypothetical protein